MFQRKFTATAVGDKKKEMKLAEEEKNKKRKSGGRGGKAKNSGQKKQDVIFDEYDDDEDFITECTSKEPNKNNNIDEDQLTASQKAKLRRCNSAELAAEERCLQESTSCDIEQKIYFSDINLITI